MSLCASVAMLYACHRTHGLSHTWNELSAETWQFVGDVQVVVEKNTQFFPFWELQMAWLDGRNLERVEPNCLTECFNAPF
jgi:hypothetical protein